MGNLGLIVSTVFPLAVYMAVGYAVFTFTKLDSKGLVGINKMCFYVLMPCLVFRCIYEVDSMGSNVGTMLIVIFISFALLPVISSIIAKKLIKENIEQASFAAASWKHNAGIIGLPVATALLNKEGLAAYVLFVAISALLGNTIMVVQMLYHINSGEKASIRKTFGTVIKNPILITCLIGAVVKATGFVLPSMAKNIIWSFNNCVTPVALMLVGCTIANNRGIVHKKEVAIACFLKLVLAPLLITGIAYLLGLRGPALAAMLIAQAVPTAANVGITAQGVGADGDFANEIICSTSILCIITLFGFAFVVVALCAN